MTRSFVIVSGIALAGIVAAVAMPVRFYARLNAAEEAAAASLLRISEAQRAFRARAGRTGYATDLASLTTPCPGQRQALLTLENGRSDYTLVLRAAEGAATTGPDCHGRPTASDYYAAAEPASDIAGAQAFAMTARGRIYVFFDGLAPREVDLAGGGLAVPLDTLDTFKIP